MSRPLPRSEKAPAPAPGAVATKALLRAADFLDLKQAEVAAIIGVSASFVSRMRDGKASLEAGSKPFQLAALLLRAWRSLDTIVGSRDETAREWLRIANHGLAEARPIDLLRTPQGLVQVCDYLDSRRGRI
jgi:putative toxin-antitoxin system antitoxin component (TIGR02293 family)